MQHLKTDLGRSPNDHESSPSADAGSAPWTLDQTAAQDEPPRNPSPPGQLRELLGGSGKWAQCPPKHGGAPSMPGFITPNWDVLTGRERALRMLGPQLGLARHPTGCYVFLEGAWTHPLSVDAFQSAIAWP